MFLLGLASGDPGMPMCIAYQPSRLQGRMPSLFGYFMTLRNSTLLPPAILRFVLTLTSRASDNKYIAPRVFVGEIDFLVTFAATLPEIVDRLKIWDSRAMMYRLFLKFAYARIAERRVVYVSRPGATKVSRIVWP
jgi:hypothetical protein